MNWMGHVWRSSDITKDALNWKPNSKRLLGGLEKKSVDKLN